MKPSAASLQPPAFDAEAFWAGVEFKKWSVLVSSHAGQRETLLVSARDREGAERCALSNSSLHGEITATARLATPGDLGCV